MKLKMHSFDFESNTITFSVPAEVMRSNRWGNVPEGVDVDLSKVTGNISLGLNYSPITNNEEKVIVLSRSLSEEDDELFVATKPVESFTRAVEIASKFTESFYDIHIARIICNFKNPEEIRDAL